MSVSSADKLESAFTDAKKAQSGALTVSGVHLSIQIKNASPN
jgi:hypothetical protein